MRLDPQDLQAIVAGVGKLVDARAKTTETNLKVSLSAQIKASEQKLQKEIRATNTALTVTRVALQAEIGDVRDELKSNIAMVRDELKSDITDVKAEIRALSKISFSMKNALILHGTDATSKDNWFPWLKIELEKQGWLVWTPNLPKSNKPNIKRYNKFLFSQKEFAYINDETVMIGHSS